MTLRALGLALAVILAGTAAVLAGPAGAPVPPSSPDPSSQPVRLAPHRAVYDLSLAASYGTRGLESARGRIAFDFTGNACEGYGLKFRQVTVLESAESGTKTSDMRTGNFESGDGRSFQFRNDTMQEGSAKTVVNGQAERQGQGGLGVRLQNPKRERFALGDAVFPNAQMRDLIAAAREGRTLVGMRLYDGSDDGHKIYETLAVIGRRIGPGTSDRLEPAARQEGLAKLSRWPVSLSYFAPGRTDMLPVYVLSFDLYENGVSRALRLDYGDFVLKGEMTRLDLLPEGSCRR